MKDVFQDEHVKPSVVSVFVFFCSRMSVGDNEPRAAAILLAGEQRRNQPVGAGHPAAQTRELPPCPLLTHDPVLVLRPQRETQFH